MLREASPARNYHPQTLRLRHTVVVGRATIARAARIFTSAQKSSLIRDRFAGLFAARRNQHEKAPAA